MHMRSINLILQRFAWSLERGCNKDPVAKQKCLEAAVTVDMRSKMIFIGLQQPEFLSSAPNLQMRSSL